jgi:hypothetical protein
VYRKTLQCTTTLPHNYIESSTALTFRLIHPESGGGRGRIRGKTEEPVMLLSLVVSRKRALSGPILLSTGLLAQSHPMILSKVDSGPGWGICMSHAMWHPVLRLMDSAKVATNLQVSDMIFLSRDTTCGCYLQAQGIQKTLGPCHETVGLPLCFDLVVVTRRRRRELEWPIFLFLVFRLMIR